MQGRRRRGVPWWGWALIVVGALAVALAIVVAVVAVPILTHENAGPSQQLDQPDASTAVAEGADGRTRTIRATAEDGGPVDLTALEAGDRLVVHGTGFDGSQGIYVAVCVIPDDPETKPGPCIGGAPQQTQDPAANEGAVQYGPSNWVSDDWAWKLFGARAYDDPVAGDFTAYLEIGEPVGDGYDCFAETCAIVTRNDHTASADRVQDVYLPISWADTAEG